MSPMTNGKADGHGSKSSDGKSAQAELYSRPGAAFPCKNLPCCQPGEQLAEVTLVGPSWHTARWLSVTASVSPRDRIVLLEGHGVECDAQAGPFVRQRYLVHPRLPTLCLGP